MVYGLLNSSRSWKNHVPVFPDSSWFAQKLRFKIGCQDSLCFLTITFSTKNNFRFLLNSCKIQEIIQGYLISPVPEKTHVLYFTISPWFIQKKIVLNPGVYAVVFSRYVPMIFYLQVLKVGLVAAWMSSSKGKKKI